MAVRKNDAQSVADVIKEVLKQKNLNKGLLENRAVHYWGVVLGDSVAKATQNIYIRNGVLFVEMRSSIVRNELMMWKSKIIENMNTAIGESIVRDIVFK